MFKILTIEELAEDAFVKAERIRILGMTNTPTDYEERKKAFIEMSLARDEANKAEQRLRAAIEYNAKAVPSPNTQSSEKPKDIPAREANIRQK